MTHGKLALLIDAENISHKYMKRILKVLEPMGTITYKRIYRDWTDTSASGWKDIVLENGLSPIQQYSYTSGKNATDFAIIIDAMDILHEGNADTFCLATSDSDFTRLAMRLRESGKYVIGLGEKKTPVSFVAACDQYIYLDTEKQEKPQKEARQEKKHLKEGRVEEKKTKGSQKKQEPKKQELKKNKPPKISIVPTEKEVEAFVLSVVRKNESRDRKTSLNDVSQELHKRYPGFRPQNYSCSQMKKLISRFHSMKMDVKTNEIFAESSIILPEKKPANIEAVEREIVQIIQKNKEGRVSLGQLNQQLVDINKEYSYKRFGYSKFSKFVHEFNSIRLSKTPSGKEEVIVVSN